MCVCIYLYIHTYTHIQIYIYTHTYTYTDMYKGFYCERFSRMVIEAGKSHYLLSVSWRPRKAGCVVPNLKQFSFLRTRKSNGISLGDWRPENQKFCPGKEKINVWVQAEKKSTLLLLLVLFKPLVDWLMPIRRQPVIFTQATGSSAKVFQKHPHRYTQK